MRHFCRTLNANYQFKYVTISFDKYGSISDQTFIFIRYSVSSLFLFCCALTKQHLVYKQNSASMESHESQESLELVLDYFSAFIFIYIKCFEQVSERSDFGGIFRICLEYEPWCER